MRLATVWAWAVVFGAIEGGNMVLWRLVLVESSLFKNTGDQTQRNLSLTLCGTACLKHDWCQLWCHVQPRECLLTSLIVSGSYQPSQADDALSCYTSRRPEFAAGASVNSSTMDGSLRIAENLVDGVYRRNKDEACTRKNLRKNAWLLVDMGAIRLISEVLLMSYFKKSDPVLQFQDIDVKVGNVQEAGNFSSYTLLGSFQGPGLSNQVVVLRPPAPLKGQYVSIQRWSTGALCIAHLEIR